MVDDLEAEVADLRSRGVVFEEFPGRQYVDGIRVDGYFKGAWFRDDEGNLLNVRSKAPREAQRIDLPSRALRVSRNGATLGARKNTK
jgi:hypothetical protein